MKIYKMPAHLRITVSSTYKGLNVTQKEYDEKAIISAVLPSKRVVYDERLNVLREAELNNNFYEILVSEIGISVVEYLRL